LGKHIMQHQVINETLAGLCDADRVGMFRLRYDTFHTRLGWDVQTTPDGQEIDAFDEDPRATYILAKSREGVDGCWRLLPTLGPNMLRDVFPALAGGQPVPAAADVWELSRFAIASDRLAAVEGADNHQIGFGPLSVALMVEAAHFAQANGISRYVTVTTAAIERVLKRQGLHVHRLGPPMRIGLVLTVACFIEVDHQTLKAIGMM
jgi:acyl homoserine lactone synthase